MIHGKAAVRLGAGMLLPLLAACAIRLGGPQPRAIRVLAYAADAGAAAEEVARRIRAVEPDYVVLAADADTSWFREVARAAGRETTRPGRAEGVTFAFLAGKALGDTTVVLTAGQERFTVHDALYDLTKRVRLDVMAFRLGAPPDQAAEPVRTLMAYVATDVPPQALIALGVLLPDGARPDVLAQTLAPFFRDAGACDRRPPDEAPRPPMQIYYAPAVRTDCRRARVTEDGAGLILEIETRG